ncbi:MAG TPA: hypothetical protein DHW02_01515, partial [Ktedonobacter sp.]|nr:hypothetical protein [Ktedonobacter sp.]
MIQSLNNVPIFQRLFVSFAFAAAIPAVVIILLGNFYLSNLSTRGQAVQTSVDAQSIASTQENNLLRMNALLQTRYNGVFASISGQIHDPALAASDGLIGADIATSEADFNSTLTSYAGTYEIATSPNMTEIRNILLNDNPTTGPGIINDQQQALSLVNGTAASTASIGGLWSAYRQLQDSTLQQLSVLEKNPPALGATLDDAFNNTYQSLYNANRTFIQLNNAWQRVVSDSSAMGKTVTSVGASVRTPVIVATALAVLLSVIIIFLTGGLANLTIAFPLRRLAALTKDISGGNTNARASVIGRDEIALVASSMNSMLDNIVQLIQRTQAERDELQSQVEKLVSEVSGAGEGDLRIQAEVTANALGVLADSFNYMVEELSSLVIRVKRVAHEVEHSTIETYDRMGQLVRSADVQIEQIARSAAEVEKMATASRQVAERAESLSKVAREARSTAHDGREAVQQTVQGIGRIQENVKDTASKVQQLGERSQEINNIVDVMSNIAHQTNRLALDASIQAAMAGANGKGFLAVAEDIRRLAERAKEQTRQITQLVRSFREDIGSVAVSMNDTERETQVGSQLTHAVGTSLESLFSVVERQAREVELISQVSIQQYQSSNTVAHIMGDVSLSTRQTGSSTHEASQNMERLARLAEQLRSSVEAFKVNEESPWEAVLGGKQGVAPNSRSNDSWSLSNTYRTVTGSAEAQRIGAPGVPGISNVPGFPVPPVISTDDSFYPMPAALPASIRQRAEQSLSRNMQEPPRWNGEGNGNGNGRSNGNGNNGNHGNGNGNGRWFTPPPASTPFPQPPQR